MYGNTAVMRRADACFSASMMINSSINRSDTGGHDVWITNTSDSRTFSLHWNRMFSLPKR